MGGFVFFRFLPINNNSDNTITTKTITQYQLSPERQIPVARPLEFAETVFRGDKVWMLVTPKSEIPANEVVNFHRVQIHERLYTVDQLATILQVAKDQKEPADLISWIQKAIIRSKNS